ncbi:HAD family hydrolase [Dactylosporangium sp. McL0621]|uniref:HAD family hydrolase n=1 Tax=Dactylosporangium sp. McL0621 TaxID=3415678 RepID=UPI003CF2D766
MTGLVLFDLDDTLVDRSAAFRRWAAELCADRSLPAGAFEWLLAADRSEGFFAAVRARFGLVDDVWAQYRRRMPELVTCRPGVLSLLTGLRAAGRRVGIVTNGHADNQLGKIRRTGLDRAVDGWAVSGELGVRKPDRALFAAAAAACGADLAGGGWMVGDNPADDIAGGRAAGLATIWIAGGRPWPRDLLPPDHTCDTVEAAAGWILPA